MKKIIATIVLLIGILSCTKDDFCLENPVTPQLILKFYDDANRINVKKVERFSIIADGIIDSLYTNQTIDSIVSIPLNTSVSETIYTIKMNNIDGKTSNNEIVKLTINYTPENIYVSRSCGFKIIFNNVTFNPDTNSWIKGFTPNTSTIENQDEAHVQIFH
ncbi:DUF6452 family protein [Polaribacter porphyrae]|uniref:Uncharacterized protein n=1 Tax=Polaribacter porphyrae TaxID=1137780 RepID=A0A2S7WJZ5_9FLAO|nr:DUF6452 family protein [Polaribacter porphyrae]PQJ77935.1 hypothetical protein BTO18_01480 [Polaribacter porphyrae]